MDDKSSILNLQRVKARFEKCVFCVFKLWGVGIFSLLVAVFFGPFVFIESVPDLEKLQHCGADGIGALEGVAKVGDDDSQRSEGPDQHRP